VERWSYYLWPESQNRVSKEGSPAPAEGRTHLLCSKKSTLTRHLNNHIFQGAISARARKSSWTIWVFRWVSIRTAQSVLRSTCAACSLDFFVSGNLPFPSFPFLPIHVKSSFNVCFPAHIVTLRTWLPLYQYLRLMKPCEQEYLIISGCKFWWAGKLFEQWFSTRKEYTSSSLELLNSFQESCGCHEVVKSGARSRSLVFSQEWLKNRV
jgi:hypothetical protein